MGIYRHSRAGSRDRCAYAIRHQPISDTLAAKSIALFVKHLKAGITTQGDDSWRIAGIASSLRGIRFMAR